MNKMTVGWIVKVFPNSDIFKKRFFVVQRVCQVVENV